jgi:hypothetical protein
MGAQEEEKAAAFSRMRAALQTRACMRGGRNPTAPARSIGWPMLGGQTREAEVEMVEGCRSLSFPMS